MKSLKERLEPYRVGPGLDSESATWYMIPESSILVILDHKKNAAMISNIGNIKGWEFFPQEEFDKRFKDFITNMQDHQ